MRSDRGRKERSSQELRTESNTQSNFTLLTLTRAASPTVFSLQAHSSYANSFVLLPASLSEGECTTETLYPPGWLAVSVELRGIETSRICVRIRVRVLGNLVNTSRHCELGTEFLVLALKGDHGLVLQCSFSSLVFPAVSRRVPNFLVFIISSCDY